MRKKNLKKIKHFFCFIESYPVLSIIKMVKHHRSF